MKLICIRSNTHLQKGVRIGFTEEPIPRPNLVRDEGDPERGSFRGCGRRSKRLALRICVEPRHIPLELSKPSAIQGP